MPDSMGYRNADDVIEWMLKVDKETFGWIETASWVFAPGGFHPAVKAVAAVRRVEEKSRA